VWYIPTVFGLLALSFIAVPILEIWLLIRVGGAIGAGSTIGLIVLTAVVGAALARHQGFAVIQKLQGAMRTGQQVGVSMIEAALVLIAGVMMLLPGFVTDAVGICLLVPFVRRPIARAIAGRARARMERGGFVVVDMNVPTGGGVPGQEQDDAPPPGVIDV
jgi:UPF0716 protein FxsA